MNLDVQLAIALDGVLIDTETTGVALPEADNVDRPWGAQVIEIAAIDGRDGSELFHSYVKPTAPFEPKAQEILEAASFPFEKLDGAPEWPAVFERFVRAVYPKQNLREQRAHDLYLKSRPMPNYKPDAFERAIARPLVAWNAGFDDRAIRQSNLHHRLRPEWDGVSKGALSFDHVWRKNAYGRTEQIPQHSCKTWGVGPWIDAMRLYCDAKGITRRYGVRQSKAIATETGVYVEAPDEDSLFYGEERRAFEESVLGRAHNALNDCLNMRELLMGRLTAEVAAL